MTENISLNRSYLKNQNGKKMPTTKSRSNAAADSYTRTAIGILVEMGAFESNGRVARLVIEEWYEKFAKGKRINTNPRTGITKITYTKNKRHAFEALTERCRMTPHSNEVYEKPKRWYDVKPLTRLCTMLFALQHNRTPYAQMTFYIGKDLIQSSKDRGVPLAKILNKRLQQRLNELLPDVEFGFWLNIEGKPDDEEALHAHGIIFVEDETWFTIDSRKRRKLVSAIKIASDEDGTMDRTRWLDLHYKELNVGWIHYSRKGRRGRRWKVKAWAEAQEEIGLQLSSTSHTLSRRTQEFYERLRPLLTAIIRDKFEEFGDDDWAKLNEGY